MGRVGYVGKNQFPPSLDVLLGPGLRTVSIESVRIGQQICCAGLPRAQQTSPDSYSQGRRSGSFDELPSGEVLTRTLC
jgi:hypothetical protein